MTLILTCLTKDYVVQTSDRRIAIIKDNKLQWHDDQSNKVLIYDNRFTFAYTGLAKLPVRKNGLDAHQSAIDWAAEQLAKGKNLVDAVHYLKNQATDLMNTNRIRRFNPQDRRLAFTGSGFDEIETGKKRTRR